MCEFFSCLVLNRGALGFEIIFNETEHHSELLRLLDLDDNDVYHTEAWARVECLPVYDGDGEVGSWIVDVDEDIEPWWWEENAYTLSDRVVELADRVNPHFQEYSRGLKEAWKKAKFTDRDFIISSNAAVREMYHSECTRALRNYVEAIKDIPGYLPYP